MKKYDFLFKKSIFGQNPAEAKELKLKFVLYFYLWAD
jgi:hypothetical protein